LGSGLGAHFFVGKPRRWGGIMKNEFLIAITQICAEKSLSREVVMDALEAALVSAYKRTFGVGQNISVKISPTTGEVKVFTRKNVVEDVADPRMEMDLKEAKTFKKDAQVGDPIDVETTPHDFGRIAAQTAKQVVLQRLREAERENVLDEYMEREGDVINGLIQRVEPRQVVIDLGKAEAILPASEQIPNERYRVGQRMRAYLLEVQRTNRGPLLTVSRTHRNFLRRLFELEVPEIFNGVVEIKAISREPGSRSKVAVGSRQAGVDPVGACVGMRGVRIQNIVRELDGEKIDVVQWDEDPAVFVANALSPAQVISVDVGRNEKVATVVVPDRLLSLAIGKDGQNARLAARMTGWKIDIKSASMAKTEEEARLSAEAKVQEEAKAAVAEAEAALGLAGQVIEEVAPQPGEITGIPGDVVAAPSGRPDMQVVPETQVQPPVVEEEEEEEEQGIPLPPLPEPVAAGRQQIRFAEDILGPSGGVPLGKKAKKEKGRKDKEEGVPKKKAKKAGRPVFQEDDLEEYDFRIK